MCSTVLIYFMFKLFCSFLLLVYTDIPSASMRVFLFRKTNPYLLKWNDALGIITWLWEINDVEHWLLQQCLRLYFHYTFACCWRWSAVPFILRCTYGCWFGIFLVISVWLIVLYMVGCSWVKSPLISRSLSEGSANSHQDTRNTSI
jgi:hypothetical protein